MSLISRPLFALGLPEDASGTFTGHGEGYDCALANIGLLRADSVKYPSSRGTAPYRKEQFDTSDNPGEQTLSQWWVRAQTDFGGGAGVKFMEPASDDEVATAFHSSAGVNPWVPGEVSLLRKMDQVTTVTPGNGCLVMGCSSSGSDAYFEASGTSLKVITNSGSTAVTWGGTNPIDSMTNDGTNYYVTDSVGVWKGTLDGGAGSKIWDISASAIIGWVKSRLVATVGPSVYELTGTGPTLPSALYNHPNTSWQWTSIAEGPGAIYLSGYAGTTSAIYKFVLNTSGVMPTLTSGIVAAQMPPGEIILSIESYIGTYLAIGTSKGVRIGIMSSNGDISYGPLVIESSRGVIDMVGRDRFMYATAGTGELNGNSGLWRIDLGNPLSDGSFPYASDVAVAGSTDVSSVTVYGASDRMVFGGRSAGSYRENASTLVDEGWIRTGYIRFGTTEDKRFLYGSLRGGGTGTFTVNTIDVAEVESFAVTGLGTDTGDFSLNRTHGEEYLALKIYFKKNLSTDDPVLTSWQVKALPAITRSRILRVPVMLFERMRNTKGTPVPVTDVHATLTALEALENSAAPVLFYDLAHATPRTELVVIEEIQFQQTSPPARAKGEGGICYLTLRTIQ